MFRFFLIKKAIEIFFYYQSYLLAYAYVKESTTTFKRHFSKFMKMAIIYLLLLNYSTIMLKPVMPYATDAIAHLLFYHEHITTVHFANGQLHAHKESFEASKKTAPENNTGNDKKTTIESEHILNTTLYDFSIPYIIQNHFSSLSFNVKSIILSSDSPPPKV